MNCKKQKLAIIIAIAIAIIAAIGIFVFISGSDERELKNQLNLGHKYLAELDYEQAIASFKKAIEIDPVNADAFFGMADAYVGKDDLEAAKSVLEDAVNRFKENGLNSDDLQSKLDEIVAELERIEAERIEAERIEAEKKRLAEEQAFFERMVGLKEQVDGAIVNHVQAYHFDAYTWEQRKELCHPLIEKLLECIDYLEERNLNEIMIKSVETDIVSRSISLEQAYHYCNDLYIRCNELDECYELRKRQAERFGTPDILVDGYSRNFVKGDTSYYDKYGRIIGFNDSKNSSKGTYSYYMGNLHTYVSIDDVGEIGTFSYEYDTEGRKIKEVYTTSASDYTRVNTYEYNGDSVIDRESIHYRAHLSESNERAYIINENGYACDKD